MINMTHVDITRTSWYQEGKQQGKQEGEKIVILRLLSKRFGELNRSICQKIDSLSLSDLEQLADDFLSFATLDDLKQWLRIKNDH